jgi:hypothetical protein
MKINPFELFLEYFSSAHMYFSVAGHSGKNYKKADFGLRISFFQNFPGQIRIPRAILPSP